jgi:hypothetical protein
MTHVLAATLLTALFAQSGTAPSIDPALIRVHVRTVATGDATDLSARRESVKDLAGALGTKKKTLAVVDDEDQADVVVDVSYRGVTVPKVVVGIGPRPGQPSEPGAPLARNVHLRVVVLARGDESAEIKNENRALESSGGWKSAADDIAKQVEKWIASRRARIIELRPR